MTAVNRAAPTGPRPPDREQLISALIPAALRAPQADPVPLATLAVTLETGDDTVVLGGARVDASGRVPARSVCAALGWQPGARLALTTRDGTILLAACGTGQITVTSRGELALPAAARQLCAITPGSWVLLAWLTRPGVLAVHRRSAIVRLVGSLHQQLLGGLPLGEFRLGDTDG